VIFCSRRLSGWSPARRACRLLARPVHARVLYNMCCKRTHACHPIGVCGCWGAPSRQAACTHAAHAHGSCVIVHQRVRPAGGSLSLYTVAPPTKLQCSVSCLARSKPSSAALMLQCGSKPHCRASACHQKKPSRPRPHLQQPLPQAPATSPAAPHRTHLATPTRVATSPQQARRTCCT
jgi:hypothetical protein